CAHTQQSMCGETCVPFYWLCDGEQDCPNGTDEQCDNQCGGQKHAWQCDDGNCIAADWRCDGDGDCMDGSDEMNCDWYSLSGCRKGQFQCLDNSSCVDSWEVCDDHIDCEDGSDEMNCADNSCLAHQWRCKNEMCIMETWKCNGIYDCGDGSDEQNCAMVVQCACEEGHRCSDGNCVAESQICDHKKDCLDGSDEPSTCDIGKLCSDNNGGCSHECEDNRWGAACSCPPGWQLQIDWQNCIDVDECAITFSPCDQLCTNTHGSFTCSCVDGYILQEETVCKSTENVTLILAAGKDHLYIFDVRSGEQKPLQPTEGSTTAVAYDLLRETYFWVTDAKTINVFVEGGLEDSVEIKFQLNKLLKLANSIAVDWFTGQVYWTDGLRETICAGLADGKGYVKVLEKNLKPGQLTLFPAKSSMFWVNYRKKAYTVIESAGMDGSNRRVLVVVSKEEPMGLTMDLPSERLYWISEYKGSIETVKVDGTGRHIFPDVLLKHQDPLGFAVFEDQFYWLVKTGLWHVSRDLKQKEVLPQTSSMSAFSLLDERQQQQSKLGAASPCVKGVCSHICLPSPVNPKGYKCACPEG
uniref:EGF-like domain-containing protein n=1 Tax=Latimeria chalumnae TaxID=7897 RepID=H2ZXM4_LATCH